MKALGIALLSLVLIAGLSFPADAQVAGTKGFGIHAAYNIPTFTLREHYSSGGIKGGALFAYVVNETWTAEVEANFSQYTGGDVEDASFTWNVSGAEVSSPSAKSEMKWITGSLAFLYHFNQGGSKLGVGGGAPYVSFGTGFYRYKNEVSGLIWPGQKSEPLDTSLLLQTIEDRRVALTVNVGLGVEYFASESFAFDIRGQYNVSLGNLRPREAWDIHEAWPLQNLDIGVRLKFYQK